MASLPLFDVHPKFDGPCLEPEDHQRLATQLTAVRELLMDGRWRTPEEMESATGYRWASISARLRDLRKERFGAYVIERRSCGERARGLFEYRMKVTR